MHAALLTFMCDKARITATIAVSDQASEGFANLFPLLIIEALGSNKSNPDTEIVHMPSGCLGVAGNMRQCRRVAKEHFRTHGAYLFQEQVELFFRHFKGWEQSGPEQAVAKRTNEVLRAKFNGRTPDDY